eukprot:TRINITY_DN25915_c0_g1_i1.p1 TRINITY_DN25915_c0_g1~~TRINITY_DN25915_c0_g1_i1.p1  ORF type:complete len:458 (+),score=55.17 TRINITY_DN25915_c0_g1_i1:18-1391(+)
MDAETAGDPPAAASAEHAASAPGKVQAQAAGARGSAVSVERQKDLVVNLFGSDRNLGTFPTRLHSDMRHLVEMLRRGKHPRLASDRVAALETALSSPGSTVGSLGQLRQQIEVWREGSRKGFDADRYYDGERAKGYTEHNRGPQETLARRALQLCSMATGGDTTKENLLAVDLGCGSGLSTATACRLSTHQVGVIGIDLSSEMLRSEEWKEVAALPAPLAGERLRCDLSQPLPFRQGVFDVAYSISAVHYLVQDSHTRSADQRISAFTRSLRECLAPGARPCVFQAYMTRESGAAAFEQFSKVARQDGWALCDLVIDQAHGGSAERDFLYLLNAPDSQALGRPARCALYQHAGATCALALESWARSKGQPPVLLDGAHRAWLGREHDRHARRLVRLHKRCATEGAVLDHAAPLGDEGALLAAKLRTAMEEAGGASGGAEVDEEAKLARLLQVLHGDG